MACPESPLAWDDRLAEVQLLACIKAAKGAGPIGKVTLREARTGGVVSTLTVPGTLNGADNCPSLVRP